MRGFTIALVLLFGAAESCIAAVKIGPNRPYAATFQELSPFYARCIPEEGTGSKGITQILRIRKDGDEVIAAYDWYNTHGLVLGWSPRAGKVSVMRLKQDEGQPPEKQIEFSFYLGDKFLKSYTTADLIKLGAVTEQDNHAVELGLKEFNKRAAYRVEGCRQVWNTNDYYYAVRLDDTHVLFFDILTGNLCRIEKEDRSERMVLLESTLEPDRK